MLSLIPCPRLRRGREQRRRQHTLPAPRKAAGLGGKRLPLRRGRWEAGWRRCRKSVAKSSVRPWRLQATCIRGACWGLKTTQSFYYMEIADFSRLFLGRKSSRQLHLALCLDGFIARNWASQKSALGSALDPLADKILISILYVSLTYADLIPVPLTYMIISRDVMLIAAVFYVRYRTLPTPRTLSKYFNPCYATARLKPTFISKVNTAVQLILVAASLAAPVFNYADSIYLQILWCCTAFTTAASAYSYYHYGRKTVQVIKDS
ncbi:cardiolipin synthase (CMP-forming) isoform X2 [Artibeus jamaicensis]|uniref:cardiolipin synthase (CMP-forming) isoform X2 n=1 Tax=Artibeus jamaicensis TaxID=9417 RepID=UPI00235A98EB|nr:cardiolipin synthase (CMP-forming) isoform X2 [Artibeus jamaicensis]